MDTGVNLLAEKFLGTSGESTISQLMIGLGTTTASISDTTLEIAVPIEDGTANDNGANTLTGSSGGDNSTDNIVTFKEGAGQSDDTSQNLIANATNATKIWTISNLSSLGTNITQTLPFGLWFFIKDQTTLDKFLTSGTALEIKLGSDSSNYFSYTRTAAQLTTGFNWITSNLVTVENLTETGTVSGNVDTFIIEVTTNNSTDTFIAGDVIYDLLRTWQSSDLVKNFDSGFPVYNSATKEINSVTTLSLLEANGFPISELLTKNTNDTGWTRDVLDTAFSKSKVEELKFDQKDFFQNS